MDLPSPLFRLFSSFQTNITIFTSNKCEKCPSGIQCWDSNPRLSGHESPPTTIRPGLVPRLSIFIDFIFWINTFSKCSFTSSARALAQELNCRASSAKELFTSPENKDFWRLLSTRTCLDRHLTSIIKKVWKTGTKIQEQSKDTPIRS